MAARPCPPRRPFPEWPQRSTLCRSAAALAELPKAARRPRLVSLGLGCDARSPTPEGSASRKAGDRPQDGSRPEVPADSALVVEPAAEMAQGRATVHNLVSSTSRRSPDARPQTRERTRRRATSSAGRLGIAAVNGRATFPLYAQKLVFSTVSRFVEAK